MKTETNQPKHTQGEWRIKKNSSTTIEVGDNGRTVATCGSYSSNLVDPTEENEANAKRIVKAVNMHDSLIEILKDRIEQLEEYIENYQGRPQQAILKLDKAQQLLKQAESK